MPILERSLADRRRRWESDFGGDQRASSAKAIRFQTSAETSPGSPTYGDQTSTNLNESVSLEIVDGWLLAENFIFKEPIPLDGLTLGAAYTLVSDTIGLTNSAGGRSPNISSSLASYVLQHAGNPTSSDFNVLVDRRSWIRWLDRLPQPMLGMRSTV